MATPTALTIFTDGGSRGNPGPAAIGVVIVDGAGKLIWETGECIGVGTNNEAEYLAFIKSLEHVLSSEELKTTPQITWKLDSKLVVEQLNRVWKIKEPRMLEYAQQAWKKLSQLSGTLSIVHIPRALNAHADKLVNRALDSA